MIPARHTQITDDELGEEGENESDEGGNRSKLRHRLGIHPPCHFGPPEMNTREVRHEHSAHHYEVEVGNDEVGLGEMDIHSQRSQEHAGKSSNREQANEAE